ncbi:hypothetical protein [Nonomuraea sp. NPDC049480]|uniref:hypothetical protein n=1 Tax=Nonomuraea sp. NPDC049480 TaxID=3364353 RepID=UPI003796F049
MIAATTPASPGPESLLLRSGRISESDWNVAFTAGAHTGRVGAELVARERVGIVGLEAACVLATFDAVFAMALFGAEPGVMEPLGHDDLLPHLLVLPGIPVERLDRETARRLEIASGWKNAGVTTQCRPLAVQPPEPAPAIQADALRHAILVKANGRRTPRDIAFSLGLGLFVVMQEIAHMAQEGLLSSSPSAAETASDDDHTVGDGSPRLPLQPRRAVAADENAEAPDIEGQEIARKW